MSDATVDAIVTMYAAAETIDELRSTIEVRDAEVATRDEKIEQLEAKAKAIRNAIRCLGNGLCQLSLAFDALSELVGSEDNGQGDD